MDSHLNGQRDRRQQHILRDVDDPRMRFGNVAHTSQMQSAAHDGVNHDRGHATIVSASQIPQMRYDGVEVIGASYDPNFENFKDPRARMFSIQSIPRDGWSDDLRNGGSEEVWGHNELPVNDWNSQASFWGSQTQFKESEIAAHERRQGTQHRGLSAGTYLLADGNYLVVLPNGQKHKISPAQFEDWRARVLAANPQIMHRHQGAPAVPGGQTPGVQAQVPQIAQQSAQPPTPPLTQPGGLLARLRKNMRR